jgi:hypothetical protein
MAIIWQVLLAWSYSTSFLLFAIFALLSFTCKLNKNGKIVPFSNIAISCGAVTDEIFNAFSLSGHFQVST